MPSDIKDARVRQISWPTLTIGVGPAKRFCSDVSFSGYNHGADLYQKETNSSLLSFIRDLRPTRALKSRPTSRHRRAGEWVNNIIIISIIVWCNWPIGVLSLARWSRSIESVNAGIWRCWSDYIKSTMVNVNIERLSVVCLSCCGPRAQQSSGSDQGSHDAEQ